MSAEDTLEKGKRYPYDSASDTRDSPATDWAHVAARGVIADLSGRRGIGQELELVEHEIRVEIVQSLAEIIRLAYQTKS